MPSSGLVPHRDPYTPRRDRLGAGACYRYRHHPAPIRSQLVTPRYASRDMSTPSTTVPAMDHPHDQPTRKAQRLLRTRFHQLMGHEVLHLRVDYQDQRQWLHVLGSARDLHGPQGRCTCCPRRVRMTVDGEPVAQA
jgi:hypothetical protein